MSDAKHRDRKEMGEMRIKQEGEHEKERRQTQKKQEEENARGQTGARKSEKKQDDIMEVEDVNTR